MTIDHPIYGSRAHLVGEVATRPVVAGALRWPARIALILGASGLLWALVFYLGMLFVG